MPKPVPKDNTKPLPTSPQTLLKLLKSLNIEHTLHNHDPIFTVEEGAHLKENIAGLHCRNLFLRDKKKRMFLVVVGNDTKVDLKALEKQLECARLSFGSPDRLWEYLGIRPGSVCPFCVLNDPKHLVQVVLDKDMMTANIVNYHPLDNAMTVGLTPAALLKFFEHTKHSPITLDLRQASP
jgi:Ala-tRNA(Pro) deacylase